MKLSMPETKELIRKMIMLQGTEPIKVLHKMFPSCQCFTPTKHLVVASSITFNLKWVSTLLYFFSDTQHLTLHWRSHVRHMI